MLDIYLGNRPLEEKMDLEALARKLEGYSGADIRYIADRSATIPFLRSVATGQEGPITDEIINEVIEATPRSVSAEMLGRFDVWGKEAATG
jgi:SpoVK/Ycf46/Vps4 family AAA+-type ATPase